jgi:hypothetical protein
MFWLKLNVLYHYKYLKLIYNIYFLVIMFPGLIDRNTKFLTFVQIFVMFIIDEQKNLLNLKGYLYGKN